MRRILTGVPEESAANRAAMADPAALDFFIDYARTQRDYSLHPPKPPSPPYDLAESRPTLLKTKVFAPLRIIYTRSITGCNPFTSIATFMRSNIARLPTKMPCRLAPLRMIGCGLVSPCRPASTPISAMWPP